MNHCCKICGGVLVEVLRYEKMPIGAQSWNTHETMDLPVHQCCACGLIQIAVKPVPYYQTALVSQTPELIKFREAGLLNFIKECSLEAKIIRDITQEPDQSDRYHAFTMFNYLEHFPNPVEILNCIWGCLPEGGVGLVEVPNFDMILKEGLFAEFTRDHLFYFTEDTLRLTLSLGGFSILGVTQAWDDYIISATVRKRLLMDTTVLLAREAQLGQDITKFMDKYNSVAIWGASHQALMIMSLYRLDRHISYIVDSSPTKQGKSAPPGHTRIVPPEVLCINPVEAIIVMVGGYTAQVLDIIKKMGVSTKIATVEKGVLHELSNV